MKSSISKKTIIGLTGLALAFSVTAAEEDSVLAGAVVEGCPLTSPPANHTNNTLKQFANDTDAGVIYDDTSSKLQLKKAGGLFKSAKLGVSDNFVAAAAGDFDEDGWTDMIVGSQVSRYLRFYKNRTYETAVPNWADPNSIRQPKFVRTRDLRGSSNVFAAGLGMTAGDFDQDGHLDLFHYRNEGSAHSTAEYVEIWRGRGNGTFLSPYQASSNRRDWGYVNWGATGSAVADWNRDGWPDIIYGVKYYSSSNSGGIFVWINDCPDVASSPPKKCSRAPKFTRTTLVYPLNFGDKGPQALTVDDFTGDGLLDVVVGGPSICTANSSSSIRMYPGVSGGGVSSSYQRLNGGKGGATVMLAADFSLDGKVDVIYGGDEWNCGSHIGGNTWYFASDGDTQPFSGGLTKQLSYHQSHGSGRLYDFDLGVVLDYDHDPDKTPDFIIADGNHSGTFFVFANRVVSKFVECGDVASGVLDLGALADQEMVVTGARLSPNMYKPTGTTVRFFMTNENPANWVEASPCTDDPSDYCVSFPKPVGRDVQWKAELCSDKPYHTKTPEISGVQIQFDYTKAQEHYRAGVVVHDGVAYVGAFRQPGDRGHFYATNAGLNKTYWDAATKLDAMSDGSRKMYTSTADGKTLLNWTVSNANNTQLQSTLGVASTAQAAAVIGWQRSKRFGVGNSGISLSRLGAVETSTPAVVPPPGLPLWYPRASPDDRKLVDDYIVAKKDRPTIVLFGSRDGALHAVYSKPSDITDPINGTEAWAFVPAKVAYELNSDRANGVESAYPDGSPTVTDIKLADGKLHTVAVVSGGNGGKSVFALDITDTGSAPVPLWHDTPGDNLAGQAHSKPTVARVKINTNERFLAIFGSGFSNDNQSAPYEKGLHVVAVDMATGKRVWKFKAKCPITTDIVSFETRDEAEPDNPEVDGFIDRVVFGDACGNVYKLNPAVELTAADGTAGWNSTAGMGSWSLGNNAGDGSKLWALFRTRKTVGAAGNTRPITGTIGVRADKTTRIVLYFGTGGLENYNPARKNQFYAVYADDGTLRSRKNGSCSGGSCEKFYGGVVVTAEQVITTRGIDPVIGSGTCDLGSSKLEAFKLDDNGAGKFTTDFTHTVTGATMSSLFGDAGAVYFATLAGSIARVGKPRAADAGDDSAIGAGGGTSDSDDGGAGTGTAGAPLSIMGWRQVY